MKLFKIMFCLFFSNIYAQPGVWSNAIIEIKSMYKNGNQIFQKGDGSIQYNRIYLVSKNGISDVWTRTVGNIEDSYKNFIYKNDTMRVKIVLPEYYKLRDIKIEKFNFIKGNYTIDMLQYIEEKHDVKYGYLIINDFPEDCLPYRKEEKE